MSLIIRLNALAIAQRPDRTETLIHAVIVRARQPGVAPVLPSASYVSGIAWNLWPGRLSSGRRRDVNAVACQLADRSKGLDCNSTTRGELAAHAATNCLVMRSVGASARGGNPAPRLPKK